MSMWCAAKEENKPALRKALMARRMALPEHEWTARSCAIQARALRMSAYAAAHSVVLYSATQREVATNEILATALAEERDVFCPKLVAPSTGAFVRVKHAGELGPGRYGILEPTDTECLSDEDLERLIVFVPGVAFDVSGNRLGRGLGWYDRALPGLGNRAALVALAFDFQVVAKIPTEDWDRKVHWIVTETKLIDCSAANALLREAL
jgi:5-formyltetrahydrofolate cyclo-ligase